MKQRTVIQLESESTMEEHFLRDELPDAVCLNLGGITSFYLPVEEEERVLKVLEKWKENYETGQEY